MEANQKQLRSWTDEGGGYQKPMRDHDFIAFLATITIIFTILVQNRNLFLLSLSLLPMRQLSFHSNKNFAATTLVQLLLTPHHRQIVFVPHHEKHEKISWLLPCVKFWQISHSLSFLPRPLLYPPLFQPLPCSMLLFSPHSFPRQLWRHNKGLTSRKKFPEKKKLQWNSRGNFQNKFGFGVFIFPRVLHKKTFPLPAWCLRKSVPKKSEGKQHIFSIITTILVSAINCSSTCPGTDKSGTETVMIAMIIDVQN